MARFYIWNEALVLVPALAERCCVNVKSGYRSGTHVLLRGDPGYLYRQLLHVFRRSEDRPVLQYAVLPRPGMSPEPVLASEFVWSGSTTPTTRRRWVGLCLSGTTIHQTELFLVEGEEAINTPKTDLIKSKRRVYLDYNFSTRARDN